MFNIEGLRSLEAKEKIGSNLDVLMRDFASGDMKAGRYIGYYYLIEAASRGDVTSQIAAGNLCEFGSVADRSSEDARYWYAKALEKDHPKRDGTMLAAGAAEGMARLGGK